MALHVTGLSAAGKAERRWLLIAVLALAFTGGCVSDVDVIGDTGGDDDIAVADVDVADSGSDGVADAVADAVPDGVADVVPDAVADAAPDVVPDAVPDAVADAVPDAAPDVVPDAVADSGSDGVADAVSDGVADTIPDAAPDIVADAVPDIVADAVPDAAPDTVADTVPDAAPDAVSDAMPDAISDAVGDSTPDTGPVDVDAADSEDAEVSDAGDAAGDASCPDGVTSACAGDSDCVGVNECQLGRCRQTSCGSVCEFSPRPGCFFVPCETGTGCDAGLLSENAGNPCLRNPKCVSNPASGATWCQYVELIPCFVTDCGDEPSQSLADAFCQSAFDGWYASEGDDLPYVPDYTCAQTWICYQYDEVDATPVCVADTTNVSAQCCADGPRGTDCGACSNATGCAVNASTTEAWECGTDQTNVLPCP